MVPLSQKKVGHGRLTSDLHQHISGYRYTSLAGFTIDARCFYQTGDMMCYNDKEGDRVKDIMKVNERQFTSEEVENAILRDVRVRGYA